MEFDQRLCIIGPDRAQAAAGPVHQGDIGLEIASDSSAGTSTQTFPLRAALARETGWTLSSYVIPDRHRCGHASIVLARPPAS